MFLGVVCRFIGVDQHFAAAFCGRRSSAAGIGDYKFLTLHCSNAAERVVASKAEVDVAVAATDVVASAYLEALANYTAAKAEFDQTIAELNTEVARQEAAERGNGEQTQPATQVTCQAKHAVTKTEVVAPQTTMPATGDASDLLGETFVIGGTVLVAAGVFLSDKRRQPIR